jgi:hypothetical protein
MAEMLGEGRKYKALLFAIGLVIVIATMLFVLALMDKELPASLGIALGTLSTAIPGYIGANVIQKKIESGRSPAGIS